MLIGEDELFRRSGYEVGDDAIDRAAAAGDDHARLPGGNERGIDARAIQPLGDFDRDDHFAATAIVGHGMDPQASLADARALGHVALVVAAEIDQFRAVPGGGRGKIGVFAKELVQAGNHRHPPAESLPARPAASC